MIPRGDSELVEVARYAAHGEMGVVFPPARRGRGDRLPTADAPFAILNGLSHFEFVQFFFCQYPSDSNGFREALKFIISA